MSEPSEWDKVLWKTQPYPDNYIPPGRFLTSLRRNPNFEPYSYWPLVLLSCSITQQTATIFIFLAMFVRLKEHLLDPLTVIWTTIVCFLAGYAIWNILSDRTTSRLTRRATHLKTFKSSLLIFFALMSLSPVLRTLTAATSSDSIWALAAILFVLHAGLADYSATNPDGQPHERLSSVLSINAAVSASVVLASRLSTDSAVFALILFSVQAFALFPMLRHRFQTSSTPIWLALTLVLSMLAVCLMWSLSVTVTWLYSTSLVFVTAVAPAILVWAQQYKNNIRGSWDVAVPKVN